LIELRKAGKGEVKLGDRIWIAATGLTGKLGKVTADGKTLSVRLTQDGAGVKTK